MKGEDLRMTLCDVAVCSDRHNLLTASAIPGLRRQQISAEGDDSKEMTERTIKRRAVQDEALDLDALPTLDRTLTIRDALRKPADQI